MPRGVKCVLVVVLLLTLSFCFIRNKNDNKKVYINGKLVEFDGVEDFIPPFINIVSDFFVSPKYRLASCGIRKSMSQLTINTMCFLHNESAFLSNHHSLNETWEDKRSCSDDDVTFRKIPENFQKFAFIRDPFERFVSLYLDKCVRGNFCYDCNSDMRCVVRKIYENLKNYKSPPTFMDLHAAPITWNCNFDKNLSDWKFFIMGADSEARKNSTFQLTQMLTKSGVPDGIVNKIKVGTLTGETTHSTHKSVRRLLAEKQVREDEIVRDYLHKIYFFDYVVFPFKRSHLDRKYRTDFWNKSL